MDPAGDILIERPVPADKPRIHAILATANFQNIGGSEMPAYPLEDCFVARFNGQIIGVAGYQVLDDMNAKTTVITIDPEWRGSGVGSLLQRRRLGYLKSLGIRRCYTNCDDERAIHWNIEHFGFRRTGELVPKTESYGRDDRDHWVNLVIDLAAWNPDE